MEFAIDSGLPPQRRLPRSRFERAGLSPQQERWFNVISAVLVVGFVFGWGYTAIRAITTGESPALLGRALTVNPLSPEAVPQPVYLLDAAMRGFASNRY